MISSGVKSEAIVEVFKVPKGMTAQQFEQQLQTELEPLVFDAQAVMPINYQTVIVSDDRVVVVCTDSLTDLDCTIIGNLITGRIQ